MHKKNAKNDHTGTIKHSNNKLTVLQILQGFDNHVFSWLFLFFTNRYINIRKNTNSIRKYPPKNNKNSKFSVTIFYLSPMLNLNFWLPYIIIYINILFKKYWITLSFLIIIKALLLFVLLLYNYIEIYFKTSQLFERSEFFGS